MRTTAKTQLEGAKTCGAINGVHNMETEKGERFSPACLVTFDVEAEALINCFVALFTCAISLWMEGCGEFMSDSGKDHKMCPEFRNKKLVAVGVWRRSPKVSHSHNTIH